MSKIRALMFPLLRTIEKGNESGIKRVVLAYHKHAKSVDIEFVEFDPREVDAYDLLVIHAGMSSRWHPQKCLCAMIHGLYWTSDYRPAEWEWRANKDVIASLRYAYSVTVPSTWVAETLQRDMHLNPLVVPHGIEWDDWQGKYDNEGYVLWNKNRQADVCDPKPAAELSKRAPKTTFVMTFTPYPELPNVMQIGLMPHAQMKKVVQHAGVYLSTTKETFAIGVLEAMASGVPVLTANHGNAPNLVEHGVSGYVYQNGNLDDMVAGLDYCLENRKVLGENAREISRQYTWAKAMIKVREAFELALSKFDKEQRPMKVER